jgi:ABC-type multidrug transport system ATPase subunit
MSAPTEPSDAGLHTGIVVRGATKYFKGELALPPTDLTAPAGAVSLVVGRNGAGKTTMLRILATLVLPDAGTVRVNGVDPVTDGRLVRQQIGLALVNERSIFWRLSVLDNLTLFARVRGVAKKQREGHCRAVLEELGLGRLAERDAHALSAGQRQRVVLGRALVGDPRVLLVDEPLRGLDAEAEQLVLDSLTSRASAGATVVVATPSLREYEALGDERVTTIAQRPEDAPARTTEDDAA